MPIDRSELSSLAELLSQLNDRIAAMAEHAVSNHEDDEAKELFGIERALAGALRRINRMLATGKR